MIGSRTIRRAENPCESIENFKFITWLCYECHAFSWSAENTLPIILAPYDAFIQSKEKEAMMARVFPAPGE
jgi:hypothetical protein